ncbi:hypothetical protein P691DRAFT_758669 [Macrolepiota fuliginosa MF-IS2]|uniref:Uncharacterized protein n=1 Tax=Macrolepiota fuliginosa MF-IS2 TaxID=1400762 RepID=A0A9P5XFU8_9AGAR|nr:hypothetical protein P691DRAFT_758669 [Macrolepiota fuliginosa MF-IS2]
MLFRLPSIVRPLSLASRRSLHFTPCRRASEDKEAFFKAFQNTSIFQKLGNHPEAVSALENFAKLLQEKGSISPVTSDINSYTPIGVDLSSGKPPSTLQMLKLAANPDFREGAKRVGEELQKAGVDFQSKELMQEMMELMKLKNATSSDGSK